MSKVTPKSLQIAIQQVLLFFIQLFPFILPLGQSSERPIWLLLVQYPNYLITVFPWIGLKIEWV